ncbi:GGDEF domain-containing protein, partial [Alteromonas facilis]|uniref:GGDEF domain-containing protein n=1 Tax=Alteromonas facilis TaxID=2048004 RepID=UPI0013DD20AB
CSDSAEHYKVLFKDPEGFVKSVNHHLRNKVIKKNEYFELTNGTFLERDYIPIFDGETYVGHLWVYKDLTNRYRLENKLKNAHNKLKVQSVTDPLTGLGNRRFFYDSITLNADISMLSVCLIDLDNFKMINDSYGHDKGDLVLKGFSKFLQAHTRESDLVARFGGEEFVLAFPDTDTAIAKRRISKLLKQIRLQKIAGLDITFSAGICQYKLGMDIDKVLHIADLAMYEVKHHGKNGVHISVQ